MAKRMRRLRAGRLQDFATGRNVVYEQAGFKGHYGKEMRDRRRRGYLAKIARKRNRKAAKR